MSRGSGREGKPRRRSQQERRETTRAALLDATIDTLIEHGYANVTTTRVVDRAGVSRGAQVHHFATKSILVSEAIGHLAKRRAEALRGSARVLPEQGIERLDAVLDLLWASHSGPLFQAALELWVAARTDPELRASLLKVERDVKNTVWEGADELFGEWARAPTFEADLLTALAAMRGLALLNSIAPQRRDADARWQQCRDRLRAMFAESRRAAGSTGRRSRAA